MHTQNVNPGCTYPLTSLKSSSIISPIIYYIRLLLDSVTIMAAAAAHLGVGSVTTPLDGDSSFRKAHFKTHKIGFSWELKSHSRYQAIVSHSQNVKAPKVAVSPLDLEDAKEPPLNLYKPKDSYTATILSVERLVGPKAPGETCHIVIDHGGNVPYWEGQSYGVIPPVGKRNRRILGCRYG
ncbi:ferredoxin--NADP reductase, root-type isozyme, chloroplastic-like [Helianthus annuus]|uniref:ferredoxin--NADP reductase, root-type isozyme, chloroplastic-like n=1 Tax=Helianthus annuus TaxID=4232 RepID=UPI000B906C9C|nr:ferredoxin--NADP reductase, root-type isozyme, chloroplastic-like [Helianthus annuus]